MADVNVKKSLLESQQLQTALLAGKTVTAGRYLVAKGETISFTGKKSLRPEVLQSVRHTLVVANEAVTVNNVLDSKQDATKYVSPFVEGQLVLVLSTSQVREKGHTTFRGEIAPVN